jgi:hypothetical protein
MFVKRRKSGGKQAFGLKDGSSFNEFVERF